MKSDVPLTSFVLKRLFDFYRDVFFFNRRESFFILNKADIFGESVFDWQLPSRLIIYHQYLTSFNTDAGDLNENWCGRFCNFLNTNLHK